MSACRIFILTIFPEIFKSFLDTSLIKKAIDKDIISIETINIRDFALPPHYNVDDEPYGGGAGMVMKPEPIFKAIQKIKEKLEGEDTLTILLTPSGEKFTQEKAVKYSKCKNIIFICGRYEGIDERVSMLCVDNEISIGDFVMMGGEIPAMAIIEATSRLIPGVIGNSESPVCESFSENLLEAPQYTRPEEFEGIRVPDVLISGHHENIKKWREEESIKKTTKVRPELLSRA